MSCQNLKYIVHCLRLRKIKLKFLADTDVTSTNWVMMEVWVVTKCFRPNLHIYWYVHQKSAQSFSKYFNCFFMKNVAFKFLAPIHQGFCCCGNWVKIWPCRCPGAPQMSSEVRILSNNCQHFIKIWLFLPNPRAKWNSLSPACLNGHETHGGVSKDNNNQEVGCDLIFNAKPRQHYYTNWKLCECVCLSSSSLSPLFDDRTSREAGLKFQC